MNLKRFRGEEPFTFKAIFEVPPTVELGKYKGIAADEQVCTITEEDVKTEIDAIRERFAKTEKREEGALVMNGDLVKMKVRRVDDVSRQSARRSNSRNTRSSWAGARTNRPLTSISSA